MSDNRNLQRARESPNDEFYTFYKDIELEVEHYKEYFENKIVYCNCDDVNSNFWKYFLHNFNELKLNKLIASSYQKEKQVYIYTYNGIEFTKMKLKGTGDFRDSECDKYYKECDIVVTNPPFSLLRDFIQKIVDYDKQFLIVGNKNGAVYKNTFPLFMNNKIRFGYNNIKEFATPDGSIKKFGNVCWITNLPVYKDTKLVLSKHYYGDNGVPRTDEYPAYDNYDAVNVDRLKDIPLDYQGVMGVPITFFDYCDSNGGGI